MDYLEKACESIDASVFSSDMLFDDERRKLLEYYVARWVRAIEEHKKSVLSDSDSDWDEEK